VTKFKKSTPRSDATGKLQETATKKTGAANKIGPGQSEVSENAGEIR
jgi:hypothetical protein